MDYLGSRFYRCDLHMHTPCDHHWRDKNSRLSAGDSGEKRLDVARQYLKACHEADLEAIGITDHNFARNPSESFIECLRQVNHDVAKELNREPLVILPGFEVQANIGKGCHVICLFPAHTDLQSVSDRLTACGLPTEARFDKDGLPQPSMSDLSKIIEVVQAKGRSQGMVICPHSLENKGVLCNEVAEMWLQKHEFTNPKLLCVEISKPIDQLSAGLRSLLKGDETCEDGWKRTRPIACICSSDSYKMHKESPDDANFIGFRTTWIRMSEPDVEGLRQAFIDRDSRIRVGGKRPEESSEHPVITRIEVDGARFYSAGPIYPSQNLNCLIGGRGSGKSTLLDYLRVALDRIGAGDLPESVRNQISRRIQDTVPPGAGIVVDINKSGVGYRVSCVRTGAGVDDFERKLVDLSSGKELSDLSIRTLFPVRFLSQGEIDATIDTKDQSFLLKMLDDFIRPDLEKLKQSCHITESQMEGLGVRRESLLDQESRRKNLLTEKTDTESKIHRIDAVKTPLEHWTLVETSDSHLARLLEECRGIMKALRDDREAISVSEIPSTADRSLLHEIVIEAQERVGKATNDLKASLDTALEQYRKEAVEYLENLISSEWKPYFSKEEVEYQALVKTLEEKGDKPAEYRQLVAELETITASLATLDEGKKEIARIDSEYSDLLKSLRTLWTQETDLRTNKASELMSRLRPQPSSKPVVEIEIVHQGDARALRDLWIRQIPDRRRLTEDDIAGFLSLVEKEVPGTTPLPQKAVEALENPEVREKVKASGRGATILEAFGPKVVRRLAITRVPDKVDYIRQDGSLAGTIDRISVGQKGLAFMNLLLASGNEPLIVDTPEEGLDNEGVFSELVPVFAREKNGRQIVVVTHNANIPVNADAELIVALECIGEIQPSLIEKWLRDAGIGITGIDLNHAAELVATKNWDGLLTSYLGRATNRKPEDFSSLVQLVAQNRSVVGKVRRRRRTASGRLEVCEGALDNPLVKGAVEDVMEGSEYAFRKRWEKYGLSPDDRGI